MSAPAHRTSAAYLRHDGAGAAVDPIWLRGEGARDALLRVCSSRLLLRDGQAQQSLMLRENGTILADVTACADDEDYLLLVERGALSREALLAHLREATAGVRGLTIEDAAASHEVVSVHGPFAWEYVAEVLGQDLVALPYLNFFRLDPEVPGSVALRAGKTGEFGYDLVLRRDAAPRVLEKLAEAAPTFDAQPIDAAALSLARFEGWFFDPALELDAIEAGPVTPVELQLQWRLSAREHVGSAAIAARRALVTEKPELSRKLACLVLSRPAQAGEMLLEGGRPVAPLLRAAVSPASGLAFASALLPTPLVHAGLVLGMADGAAKVVAPPLLDNRSLYVDARRHAWRTRDEIAFGAFTRLTAPTPEDAA